MHTHSQCHFRVLPLSTHTLTYNLYPVTAGLVPLPHLDLNYPREPKANEHLMHSTLPTTIFIKVARDMYTPTASILSNLRTVLDLCIANHLIETLVSCESLQKTSGEAHAQCHSLSWALFSLKLSSGTIVATPGHTQLSKKSFLRYVVH